MKKFIIVSVVMLFLVFLFIGCVIYVGDVSVLEGSDFSFILGNIDIVEGKYVGDIFFVNGNVEISDYGGVDEVSIVNGNFEMGSYVFVWNIDIVNGDVSVVLYFNVFKGVEIVNGNVMFFM